MGGKIPDRSIWTPLAIYLQVTAAWNQLSSCVGQVSNKEQHEKTSVSNDDYGSDPDQRNHLHLVRGRRGDSDRFVQIAEHIADS